MQYRAYVKHKFPLQRAIGATAHVCSLSRQLKMGLRTASWALIVAIHEGHDPTVLELEHASVVHFNRLLHVARAKVARSIVAWSSSACVHAPLCPLHRCPPHLLVAEEGASAVIEVAEQVICSDLISRGPRTLSHLLTCHSGPPIDHPTPTPAFTAVVQLQLEPYRIFGTPLTSILQSKSKCCIKNIKFSFWLVLETFT